MYVCSSAKNIIWNLSECVKFAKEQEYKKIRNYFLLMVIVKWSWHESLRLLIIILFYKIGMDG